MYSEQGGGGSVPAEGKNSQMYSFDKKTWRNMYQQERGREKYACDLGEGKKRLYKAAEGRGKKRSTCPTQAKKRGRVRLVKIKKEGFARVKEKKLILDVETKKN